MALALANVELADNFNTWRLRTNDIITAAVPADGTAVISANVTFGASSTFNGSITATSITVSGNVAVTGDVSAANFNTTSDIRLKENITTAVGSRVFEMRGVNYSKDGEQSAGVIAQELQPIAPELVVTDSDGYMSVRYDGLSAYLIEAIKDLKKEIEELKSQINK